jgi:hypothetical protein
MELADKLFELSSFLFRQSIDETIILAAARSGVDFTDETFRKRFPTFEEIHPDYGDNVAKFDLGQMEDEIQNILREKEIILVKQIHHLIVNHLLCLKNEDEKRSFITTVHRQVSMLLFDAIAALGIIDDYHTNPDEGYPFVFSGNTMNPHWAEVYFNEFKLAVTYLKQLIDQRYRYYIDDSSMEEINQIESDVENRTYKGSGLVLFSGIFQNSEDHLVKSYPKLKWNGSGIELTELALALIHNESVEIDGGKNTQGELGAQLFRLFNYKPNITAKEFPFEVNELKKLHQKSVFLRVLAPVVDKYIAESTRKNK